MKIFKRIVVLKKQKGEIKTVKINGIIYDNDQEIAKNLHKFFMNYMKEIINQLNNVNI